MSISSRRLLGWLVLSLVGGAALIWCFKERRHSKSELIKFVPAKTIEVGDSFGMSGDHVSEVPLTEESHGARNNDCIT